jgi:hypothetical protein
MTPALALVMWSCWCNAVVADPELTPAAAFTQNERLKAPVTVEAQALPLRRVLENIIDQLEEQELGRIGVVWGPGVSNNTTITAKIADKPLGSVLNTLLREHDLSYRVVSKSDDRADGWIQIVRGASPPDEGAEPEDMPSKATPEEEQSAKQRLDLAKKFLGEKKNADARVMLNFVIKKHPETQAAREAKKLLESLGRD